MKRIVFVVLGVFLSYAIVHAQKLNVEIRGIRSEKGNIMVMAQAEQDSKPVYSMVKANKGTVNVLLDKVPWKQFTISIFHDENEDRKMNMDDRGMPLEGFAREKCEMKQDSTLVKVKLYYPAKE